MIFLKKIQSRNEKDISTLAHKVQLWQNTKLVFLPFENVQISFF